MKLTKQRLKEIIREELAEGERGDRAWASNPNNPLYSGEDVASQLYTVNIELGEFSAPDLDAAIQTAKNWLEMGLELQDGTSPEVLDALGAEEGL